MRRFGGALAIAGTMLIASSSQAGAIDLLTGDGYLLALAQDATERKAADDCLAGTLDGLLVINEVTATGEDRMFCLSAERVAVLDNALLREQFTDWLRDPPASTAAGPDPNALPLAVLVWAFLGAKFPCDEPAAGAVDRDIRSPIAGIGA